MQFLHSLYKHNNIIVRSMKYFPTFTTHYSIVLCMQTNGHITRNVSSVIFSSHDDHLRCKFKIFNAIIAISNDKYIDDMLLLIAK